MLGHPQAPWAGVGGLAAAGAILLYLAVRHLNSVSHPMVEFSAMRVPTFAVTIWGGSFFCLGVSVIPFLTPLMFQIGFGYSAAESGTMLMAVFAGNQVIKPATTTILRWGIVAMVRHADYIGAWLAIIRHDNRAILRAASAASKAAGYLLAFRGTAGTGANDDDDPDGASTMAKAGRAVA